MSTAPTIKGGCECGAVRYAVTGPVRKVVYCHCGQCRRTSGHYVAATACASDDLSFAEEFGLTWYASSDAADRGFCSVCGSSLFYRPNHGRHISIMAGTVDMPSGLTASRHIFTAEASDFYTPGDGLPQHPGTHNDLWEDNAT